MKNKKPIHKFNGGKGATLCNKCRAIICEELTNDLYCHEHGGGRKYKYLLIRHDGMIIQGDTAIWVEYNQDGTFSDRFDEINEGRNLIIDFAGGNFKWQTTQVKQIIESEPHYIKFKTKNSNYELFINQ
jgi:hypothetical protein